MKKETYVELKIGDSVIFADDVEIEYTEHFVSYCGYGERASIDISSIWVDGFDLLNANLDSGPNNFDLLYLSYELGLQIKKQLEECEKFVDECLVNIKWNPEFGYHELD